MLIDMLYTKLHMAQPVPGSQTREKLAGGKEEEVSSRFISCLLFRNSADPTISKPGTGYIWPILSVVKSGRY